MNYLPRIVAIGLWSALVMAAVAGCSRQEPEPPAPMQEHVEPRRPVVRREALPEKPPQLLSQPQLAELNSAPEQQDPTPRAPRANIQKPSRSAKQQEADAVFDHPALLRIQIQIPQAGLNLLSRTRWENGSRPEAKAIVREGGVVYTNVAVHLKGSAGSFRSVDQKPALTLNFDKFAPDQSFHGLHKISLNNSVQDSTFLCEKMARELFIAAGVPTPRASHALVELNGRYLGMYVVLEGANKQFLKRYFDNAKGNLYDGGFCGDIGRRLAVNCGENPNNSTGLRALRDAVRDGSYARLEKALDIDRFVSMVALETILGHWDGYTMNRNNWRVFHDLDANRMVFIPHGMDQLFGAGRDFNANGSVMPHHVQGDVTRAVLATAEGQRRYRERVAQICTDVFKTSEIVARIDEIVSGVAPLIAETDAQAARSFRQRANSLKSRVIARGEGIRRQFGVPVKPVEFGSQGILPLKDWKHGLASGEPILSETNQPPGKRILVINTGESASSSSWRTRVPLAPGKYQFEGRVRVIGVAIAPGDNRSGAGLRVSKGNMPPKLSGTTDWKESKYPFEVASPGADVELVCELKATAGEAWFDASSLRLVRVQ
jgi:spore coat protein H